MISMQNMNRKVFISVLTFYDYDITMNTLQIHLTACAAMISH